MQEHSAGAPGSPQADRPVLRLEGDQESQDMKLKQVQQVKDEFSLLSRLSHPFIVHVPPRHMGIEGLVQDNRCLYYLLEYVGGGSFSPLFAAATPSPGHCVRAQSM